MSKKLIAFAAMVLLLVGVSYAQINQTGAIKGVVKTADGALLPGVAVELRSPAIVLEKMETVTNENGQYRFVNLPPGVYEVSFKLEGMNSLVRQDIRVGSGVTTDVDGAMEVGQISENVVVTGQAPTVDRQATAKTSNITSQLIKSIPTGRTVADIFSLAPGVTNGTAHGSSVRENSWAIDGVNVNDPVVGTQGATVATDVLEEVAVTAGGITAEYANATGAVVNAVTKSGGNEFSGTVSVHYNHESLQSDNTKGTPLEGSKSGDKYVLAPSFSLGGPIIKNKVWFFTNFEMINRESYVSGYPLGGDQIPTDNKNYKLYGKVTFQPAQADKVYLSFQHSDTKMNHRGADWNIPEEGTLKQTTPTNMVNMQWTHVFSDSLIGNLKGAMVLSKFDMMAKVDGASIYNYESDTYEGGYGNNDINKRDKIQIDGDLTYFMDDFMGTHQWKAGFQLQFAKDNWKLQYLGPTDSMGFRSNVVYLYDGDPLLIVYRKNLDQSQEQRIMAFYLQDTWNPIRNLTINLGAHMEIQKGIIPKQNEASAGGYFLPEFFGNRYPFDDAVREDMTVADWSNLSPRFGISYDLLGDGTTLLKGSYAKYYQALNSQWFNGFNPNAQSLYWGAYDPATMQVTQLQGYYLPTRTNPKWGNYELKNPTSEEITVGIERELMEDWSISARGIFKKSTDILEDVDANSVDVETLLTTGELVWKNWTPVYATGPNGEEVRFWEKQQVQPQDMYSINAPGESRKYKALEVSLKKRFSKGWMMEASYVLSKVEGLFNSDFNATTSITSYYNEPSVHEHAVGRLENDRRHYLKVYGLVQGPLGINISGMFRMYSGNRYSRFMRNVDLGVALKNVSTQTVRVSERGAYGLPTQHVLDLRLEKQFEIGSKLRLAVFADCFNVFNEGKATEEYTTDGSSAKPFGTMTSISDPRVFRLGGRIEF